MEELDFDLDRSGYVPVYRKLLDEVFFQDSHYVHVWIYILLNVNHKKGFFKFIEINPGQCFVGRKSIAEATNINEYKIQRILKYLEEKEYIAQQMHSHGRVITVLSWDKYNNNAHQVHNTCTTDAQHVHTNNNNKNDNNNIKENNIITKEKKETQKQVFAKPTIDEIKLYAIENKYTFDVEKFFSYYESNGWMIGRNKMKSWRAACSTWQKNQKVETKKTLDDYKGACF